MGALLGLANLALAEGDTHKAASLLTEAQVWRERWEGKDSGREGEERKKKGKERGREGEREEETEKEEAGGCIYGLMVLC